MFPMNYYASKMKFVCKSYGPSKAIVQIFPTCSNCDHVSVLQFEYGDLIMCGSPLNTYRGIKNILRWVLKPKI